jgi:hypothetical protein
MGERLQFVARRLASEPMAELVQSDHCFQSVVQELLMLRERHMLFPWSQISVERGPMCGLLNIC